MTRQFDHDEPAGSEVSFEFTAPTSFSLVKVYSDGGGDDLFRVLKNREVLSDAPTHFFPLDKFECLVRLRAARDRAAVLLRVEAVEDARAFESAGLETVDLWSGIVDELKRQR